MTLARDPAVAAALLRRETRRAQFARDEVRDSKPGWKIILLSSLLPIAIMLAPSLMPYFAMAWMIRCAVKLIPYVPWANSPGKRVVAGISMFFTVLVLNAVVFFLGLVMFLLTYSCCRG